MYTSHIAVVEFVGTWVEESLLKWLHPTAASWQMECTDVTTVEELSVFCRYHHSAMVVYNI